MYLKRGTTVFLSSLLLVASCKDSTAFSPKSQAAQKFTTQKRNKHLSSALSTKKNNDEGPQDGKNDQRDGTSISRGGGGDNELPSVIPDMPTMNDYRKFYFPCLGLWVAGPLLSLVDTSFVGLSGTPATSAAQLAALGPATTFFDGATYLFAFLNVATTNLYSSARAQFGEESSKAEGVVRTASKVSLICGFGVLVLLLTSSRALLSLYIGEKASATPNLLNSAVDYVNIRALSMPTTLLLNSLQAALLGAKDSVTPLVAIMISTLVNMFGDYMLINRFKMGLRGAAIATTAAQWAATVAIVGAAKKRLLHGKPLGIVGRKKRGIDNGGVTSKSFLKFAAPVLTLILGKLAAFGFMTHVAAAVPGQPTTLASHQIILSLFFFTSPFMEVISQTAQTFLPPFTAPVMDYVADVRKKIPDFDPESHPGIQAWNKTAYKVATRLFGVGMIVAVIIATAASSIPAYFAGALTSDETVKTAVKPLAKYLWAGAFLTAPVAVSEGVLLARRELGYLATVYIASTAVFPTFLLQIKKTAGPVVDVWSYFAWFQLFRAVCFAGKIWGGSLLKKIGLGRKRATPAAAAASD